MKKINITELLKISREIDAYNGKLRFAYSFQAESYKQHIADAESLFEEKSAALAAAIDQAQRGARVRTIVVSEVIDFVKKIENYLNISGAAMKGTSAIINVNAQKFPNAYHGVPESTYFKVERTAGGWFVTNIYRDICGNKAFQITLSDTAKDAYLKKAASLD